MEKLKTGTTLVALKFKEGVVLAADKQTTLGESIIVRDTIKIHKLANNLYLAASGVVSDIQQLIKIFKIEKELFELRNNRPMSVKEMANLMATVNYYGLRNFIPRIAGFILVGFDEKDYYLFQISPDGVLEESKDYVFSGSGMIFAMPTLDAIYKENMNKEEAKKVAIEAIKVAAKRDTFSGIGYDLVVLTKKKIEKESGKIDPYKVESKRVVEEVK